MRERRQGREALDLGPGADAVVRREEDSELGELFDPGLNVFIGFEKVFFLAKKRKMREKKNAKNPERSRSV